MDYSPPGSAVHGIFQARILEWVAISPPEDLPDPGIQLASPSLQANSLSLEPSGKSQGMVQRYHIIIKLGLFKNENWVSTQTLINVIKRENRKNHMIISFN